MGLLISAILVLVFVSIIAFGYYLSIEGRSELERWKDSVKDCKMVLQCSCGSSGKRIRECVEDIGGMYSTIYICSSCHREVQERWVPDFDKRKREVWNTIGSGHISQL